MSKATASARTKTKPAAKRAEVGPAMWGRDIFVEALEREGVEVIFAYPGGASMEIHQSLTHSKIRTILPRHEQGGSDFPHLRDLHAQSIGTLEVYSIKCRSTY